MTRTKSLLKVPVVMAALALLYLGLVAGFSHNPYYMQILNMAAINTIMAVSLNLINGFTGQFSIGHAGFMGVGAYVAAVCSVFYKIPYLIALLMGALAAAVVGLVVGIPTLRLKGDYLAIATLGFAEIIRVIIVNIQKVGGPRGFLGIPPYTSLLWTYLFAVGTVVVISNFVNSSPGRACLAVREDEVAAESMGVNSTKYKVIAFVMGAFFAGLGGGLLVHLLSIAHPTMFTFLKSVDFLIMIVVGGQGSITGSVTAASFITVISEALRKFEVWRMLAYSLVLIMIMLTRPQGLLGGKELTWEGIVNVPGRLRRFRLPKVGGGRVGTAGH